MYIGYQILSQVHQSVIVFVSDTSQLLLPDQTIRVTIIIILQISVEISCHLKLMQL